MTISGGRSTPGSISFTSTRNCVWPGNRDLRLVSRVARTRWCRTRSSRRPSPRSTTSYARGFDYSEDRTKRRFRLWLSGTEYQRRCTGPVGSRFGLPVSPPAANSRIERRSLRVSSSRPLTTRVTSLGRSRTDCLARRSAVCDPRCASNRCVHFRRWRPLSAGSSRARADRRRTDPDHPA